MPLRVIGAGVGRTGTLSLKLALEQLTGGACYHMTEVFGHPEHVPVWHRAVLGEPPPDWDTVFGAYTAAVDWPVAAFWRELADAYPDAAVLLSTRDADSWWRSANATIFQVVARAQADERAAASSVDDVGAAQVAMAVDMLRHRFTRDWADEEAAKAAYERHNATVRASVPPSRLVEWRPGDGWAPLCAALAVDVPDAPFPHVNSTEEFRTMANLDPPPD
jgi:hypothetical protein